MNGKTKDSFPQTAPDISQLGSKINSPLFDQLRTVLEEGYRVSPRIEYSRCSMEPGWNIKYKKSGRALCTIYPRAGFFTCMISIGKREETACQLLLPTLTPSVQQLYQASTPMKMGRWLMIDVTDEQILEDVKKCLSCEPTDLGKKQSKIKRK